MVVVVVGGEPRAGGGWGARRGRWQRRQASLPINSFPPSPSSSSSSSLQFRFSDPRSCPTHTLALGRLIRRHAARRRRGGGGGGGRWRGVTVPRRAEAAVGPLRRGDPWPGEEGPRLARHIRLRRGRRSRLRRRCADAARAQGQDQLPAPRRSRPPPPSHARRRRRSSSAVHDVSHRHGRLDAAGR